MEDLSVNFTNSSIELYSRISLQKTALVDANAFINAENMYDEIGSEIITKTLPNLEVDIKVIREELYAVNTKPIYRLKDCLNYGIQEKQLLGYSDKLFSCDGSNLDDTNIESSNGINSQFLIPYTASATISSCSWENGNLNVKYIDKTGKCFQVAYSPHSLKHTGDRSILFQAIQIGVKSTFVITDEYIRKYKRNLGYDLAINGIISYSMWHILPICVIKKIITTEKMLEKAKLLRQFTNHYVDDESLTKAVMMINNKYPGTSLE